MAKEIVKGYQQVSLIATGMLGTVLKVRRAGTNDMFALKICRRKSREHASAIRSLINEYEMLNRVDHPNVVTVHELFVTKRWFRPVEAAMLMDLLVGPHLGQLAGQGIPRLVALLVQVADAMAHLHGRGIIHGDMKPHHVVVVDRSVAKVIDLGLASMRGRAPRRVRGTLDYMAPEQAVNRIMNERTDIFNLGATMHKALTGLTLPSEVKRGKLQEQYVPMSKKVGQFPSPRERNPAIPAKLDELVMKCCKRMPTARPASMAMVRDELRSIQAELAFHAGEASI